ncbi:MAG TPA: alpha/beta hydrolase [Croceibacterium sp.]|nr:alpha/beta hydrolase [Croceibacterium sp.]
MRRWVEVFVAAAALAAVGLPAAAQPGPPPGPPPEVLAAYASTADGVRLPDGRLLNFVCMGEGSPTVILTPGMGNVSFGAWAAVQPAIAKATRVCAWDRPGFGFSDGVSSEQTVATTTADLEAALASGKIAGPYVMVGHSLGAFESLLFADRHPDQVAGMVLLDPSIPDQMERFARIGMPRSNQGANPMALAVRQCAADIRSGVARFGGADPNGCFAYPPVWPRALTQALGEKVMNPLQYESMASFLASDAQNWRIVVNPARSYGDMPLIVLTALLEPPPPPNAPAEMVAALAARAVEWNKAHDELAALSTRGINARVPGGTHGLQDSRPQVVIDAVEAVVAEARSAMR